jgi:hypothetical protein
MVMLIHRLLENTAFGPTDVEAMAQAFESICGQLGITQADERDVIARRVIDCAKRGTLDSQDIRNMVLSEFQGQAAGRLRVRSAGHALPGLQS